MNDRLTRKEIRRDEFADVVGKGMEYAETHTRAILYAVGAIALVTLLTGAVYLFLNHRTDKANEALGHALKAYAAPVDASAPKPDDPQAPSFATDAARKERSRQLLQGVRDDFGSTDAADVADLYLAEMDAENGKLADARKVWESFVKEHKGHMLAGQAQLNLLALDRKEGKAQEVVQKLRAMLEDAEPPLPQDVVLYELGDTLEQLGQKPEALLQYQRILDEYPQSPYHSEAQQKVAALDPTRSVGMPMVGTPG
jgi:tetratricopeptide (TPR) repeat protein